MKPHISECELSCANLIEESMEYHRNRLALSVLAGAAVSALAVGINPNLKGNKLISAGVALGTGVALAAGVKYHPTAAKELPGDLMGNVNVGLTSLAITNITSGFADYLTTSTKTIEQEY